MINRHEARIQAVIERELKDAAADPDPVNRADREAYLMIVVCGRLALAEWQRSVWDNPTPRPAGPIVPTMLATLPPRELTDALTVLGHAAQYLGKRIYIYATLLAAV